MKSSRIDGRGVLPFTCKHADGYNNGTDGRICWQCAEQRAEELEEVIAVLGRATQSTIRGIENNDGSVKENLVTALLTARAYFNNRAYDHKTDLGDWLTD